MSHKTDSYLCADYVCAQSVFSVNITSVDGCHPLKITSTGCFDHQCLSF